MSVPILRNRTMQIYLLLLEIKLGKPYLAVHCSGT